MMATVSQRIEAYLIANPRWVSDLELCRVFQINERELRQQGKNPGLASEFSISGNLGRKHIDYATSEEWEAYVDRYRPAAIRALQRIKRLRGRRERSLECRGVVIDPHTGQYGLPITG